LIRSIGDRGMLGAAGVVGDEPLQESAWPYVKAFLDAATEFRVPTALVTNGFELASFVSRLLDYPTLRVLVSLDGIGNDHDRIRRKPGAFNRIEKGIRLAVQQPTLRKNLSIATTIVPRNLDRLPDILRFVSSEGVPRMVISPVLSFARLKPVRAQSKRLADAAKKASELVSLPESLKVSVHFADEFGLLGRWEEELRAAGVDVMVPRRPPDLIRVDAEGRIESLRTIRDGKSTGLLLSFDPADTDTIVNELLGMEFAQIQVAA
jgi:MoaA/NifB/PqqE/SkfB family radical SAM enzyme